MLFYLYIFLCAACTFGRPPQHSLGGAVEVMAWAHQPGVAQGLEREVLASLARRGKISTEGFMVNLVDVQETPQVYFPAQGTLWQVQLLVEVSGQNLEVPLQFHGQAHYIYIDGTSFVESRQQGYSQAISQIAEQLTATLSYAPEPENSIAPNKAKD